MAINTPVDLFDEAELLDYGYRPEPLQGEPIQQAAGQPDVNGMDIEESLLSTPSLPQPAPSSTAVES